MTETIDYKMICAQEETFKRLMEAQNGTLKDIANIMRAGAGQSPLLDDIYVAMLDGTRDTYRRVMRSWFLANGANTASTEELTALVDKWYKITRKKWAGGQTFTQPSIANPSTGTKFGDNADMTSTPSTATVKNQDDYEGNPLFAITDCNWTLDESGNILITALDGITDGFERNNPSKLVGVLQQSGYVISSEGDTEYSRGISSHKISGYDYCKPYKEAVKREG